MGTTLTGTTPATTYDSLIKVTDNGPLSGTAKYLSDGLGNDSVLAVSTANVGVGIIPSANIGNLQIGGTANASLFSQQGTDTVRAGVRASGRVGIVFDSSDVTYTNRMWYLDSVGANGSLTIGRQGLDVMTFANAGNVGIGTSSPTNLLHLAGSSYTPSLRLGSVSVGYHWDIGRENQTTGDFLFLNAQGGSASERLRITSAGLVGIGTSSPTALLTVAGTSDLAWSASTSKLQVSRSATVARFQNYENGSASSIALQWDGGNVGIGTDLPTEPLHVNGDARATNLGINFAAQSDARIFVYDNSVNSGLVIQQDSASGVIAKFNGSGGVTKVRIDADGLKFGSDTAAANALDDYEEGTWTMGITFGGASTGNAYSSNTGTYVKIGKQVTCTGIIVLSTKGSATGSASLTGLPFTIATGSANYAAVTLRMNAVSFANQYQGYAALGTTYIDMEETTEAGVVTGLNETNFISGSAVMVSVTYFV